MAPSRAISILTRVADGLAAVHDTGLVHRDLKPDNIIIEDGTGRPVLVDFGLADRQDQKGIFGGTPHYAPPEQNRGEPASPASDVYAFGVMAFELFAGRLPFQSDEARELLRLHASAEPPLLSSIVPTLVAFDHVVARAMHKDLARRYKDASALARDFATASAAFSAPK